MGFHRRLGAFFFSKILFEYGCKYPQVDLQIVEGTSKKIEALVMNDQVDLGVVIEPYENPHMRLKTVYRSDVVLAVARNHRLAERTEVEIAELRDEPMLMVSKDYMFHDQVLAHYRQAGFTPNITFTTSQWDLLLEMTAENQGVTLIGRPLVEKLYSGRIKCISLQNPEFLWTLGLISKNVKRFPALQRAFGIFAMKFEGDQTSQPVANLPAPFEKRRGQNCTAQSCPRRFTTFYM